MILFELKEIIEVCDYLELENPSYKADHMIGSFCEYCSPYIFSKKGDKLKHDKLRSASENCKKKNEKVKS